MATTTTYVPMDTYHMEVHITWASPLDGATRLVLKGKFPDQHIALQRMKREILTVRERQIHLVALHSYHVVPLYDQATCALTKRHHHVIKQTQDGMKVTQKYYTYYAKASELYQLGMRPTPHEKLNVALKTLYEDHLPRQYDIGLKRIPYTCIHN